MRAFVAIDLPPLEGPIPPELRPEDHLTLQFFEDLPGDRLPVAVEAMQSTAGGTAPFPLVVQGVGAFPTLHRPRVVWAGMGEGAANAQALGDRLRAAMASRGFPVEDRPFVPHLTLARVRSPRDAVWASRFLANPEHAGRVWVRTTVSEIVLKESELLPTGARHTVRARVGLGTSPSPPPSGQRTD